MRRGVSKKYIPGPRVFEFPSNTSYDEFISLVKPFFFNDSTGELYLANASGIPFEIDANTWQLSQFVRAHGPQVVSATVSGKSDDVNGSLCFIIHYYIKHVAMNTATNFSEITHSPSHSMSGMLTN